MPRSYRKIVLTRNHLRSLFNVPEEVDIRTAYIETDPLTVHILLGVDQDDMPWPASTYEPEGIEDSESQILPRLLTGGYFDERVSNNQG